MTDFAICNGGLIVPKNVRCSEGVWTNRTVDEEIVPAVTDKQAVIYKIIVYADVDGKEIRLESNTQDVGEIGVDSRKDGVYDFYPFCIIGGTSQSIHFDANGAIGSNVYWMVWYEHIDPIIRT